MTAPIETHKLADLRILILAPRGKDARLLSSLLDRASLTNQVTTSVQELVDAIQHGAGVALIAEEALTSNSISQLAEVLRHQPRWSDFPLIVLTVSGEVTGRSQKRRAMREPLGNVLLLERPLRPETLLGTVESALRIRRRQYQLCQQVEQFKLAEEALRKSEKLAVAGRLSASIAHEINNPLESVMNLLYLMRTATREELPPYLQMAEQELGRVTEITKQTLRFYREPAKHAMTDVSKVLESVLALFHSRIVALNILLEKQFRPIPSIWGGEGELRQLFANLVGNAIDSMPGGGRLRIAARCAHSLHGDPPARGVRVTVADTGCGIPPEILEKVFEPFVSTKGDTGTGLGLWVSSEILHKHAGTICVRSSTSPDHSGTVFSVFLPNRGKTPQSVEETNDEIEEITCIEVA